MAYGAITVGVTATLIPGGGLTRIIYNNGTVPVYCGDDASVTTATGVPIMPGGNWRTSSPVWAIAGSAGQDVRWVVG